jgi:tRNA nucleotidyltransferase (CCA-adding enzyme)
MTENYLAGRETGENPDIIRTVGCEADRRRIPAYLVGGIVRDIILKRKNGDIDIVVEADALSFAREVAKTLKAGVKVYGQFGTATLELPGSLRVDIATARKEWYPLSGSLPKVCPGTLQDDLYRRDFTINAMAVSLNKDSFGELIDEFGGMADVDKKRVRVLHDRSFLDDPTRILRAVRFEQRFGFRIERRTLRLLKEAIADDVVRNVKPPRYFAEFKKMLSEANPLPCLKRLYVLKGLHFVDSRLRLDIPFLKKIYGKGTLLKEKFPFYSRCPLWLIYFMAILRHGEGPWLEAILNKFSLRTDDKQSILQILKMGDLTRRLSSPGLRRSQVCGILRSLSPAAILYLCAGTSSPRIRKRLDEYAGGDAGIRIHINGDDLKRMGVRSGRGIGTILSRVLDMKIDRQIMSEKEELDAARTFMRQG